MSDIELRTSMLLGESAFNTLKKTTACIVGLGGVGGAAFECLVRSGVEKIVIIDFDIIDGSNLNRQILYTNADIGKIKVEVARKKALDINPEIEIIRFNEFLDVETLNKLENLKIDFLIDAIDSMDAKCQLIDYCIKKNISFISSLGMANRIDVTKIEIKRLDKTYNCPFARKLRLELKKRQIDLKNIMTVFSSEEPLKKLQTPSSMMMVPVTAGLACISYLINKIYTDKEHEL